MFEYDEVPDIDRLSMAACIFLITALSCVCWAGLIAGARVLFGF